MIWIILATLIVVFIVGFRVLTSGPRRTIRRFSERLGLSPEPTESLIDQMGREAGQEFLHYLSRPDPSHLQNAAHILLIWQCVIIDNSEQNLTHWQRQLKTCRLSAPITDSQVRLALRFLRETEPSPADIREFQHRYNAQFQPEDGVIWLQ